jgi:DNA-binding transcriptional regulator YbjK
MCTTGVEGLQAFFSDVTHRLRRKLTTVKSVQPACVLNTQYKLFNKRYIYVKCKENLLLIT